MDLDRAPSSEPPDDRAPATRPPRDPRLEIPEVLRTPIDHPSLTPRPSKVPGLSGMADISRALAIALDFLFIGIAGAGVGWLIDRQLGSSPFGLMIGLAAGFGGGTYRLIARLNADEKREAQSRKPRTPTG